MTAAEATEMSDIQRGRERRRPPAWLWFTLGAVLVPVAFIVLLFAHGHVEDGGPGGSLAYGFPMILAGLACASIVLGFRSLPRAGGVPGRWAATLLGGLGIGVVAGLTGVINGDVQETGHIIVPPWLIVAAIIAGVAATVWVWRGMDEAAREAHKWAWYWGATVGIALAMPLFFFGGQGERLRAQFGLTNNFEQGALSLLALQIAGYGLAWGFWWLRRR